MSPKHPTKCSAGSSTPTPDTASALSSRLPCRSGLARECIRSGSHFAWPGPFAGKPAPTRGLPCHGCFAIFRGVNGTIVPP
ncbi:hypothetical protein DV532_01905 [Pseudomonas sp. Leaf58]|nr:hypothetical protein DV532_01905 [Pseudomonas sp. Leaf58]